jgi:uncharacterized delta-60 repeat protein
VVAVQAADRILVAGNAAGLGLARFNPDGTPDDTFGSGGVVVTSLPDAPGSVALQPDGSILVAGKQIPVGPGGNLVVVRFNAADGSLDTSFGTNGVAATTGDLFNWDVAMALEPDGRIVLAGESDHFNPSEFGLARFLATGPQVGSVSASANPNNTVTLTASSVVALNPGSTVTQVAFYGDSNGDGKLEPGTDTLLGYASQTSPGVWTFTFTVNLTPGTYTLFSQAEDSYGAFGDPLALSFQVL